MPLELIVLSNEGWPHDSLALSLSHRERIGSTGLGQRVAIPHARVKGLDRIQPIYILRKFAIPFDAPDGRFVSDILALLVPKQATEEHAICGALNVMRTAQRPDGRFSGQLNRAATAIALALSPDRGVLHVDTFAKYTAASSKKHFRLAAGCIQRLPRDDADS